MAGNKIFLSLAVFLVLSLFAGLSFAQTNTLKVTEEHPFLINGEWIPAKELAVGNEIKTIDGKTARITGIKDVVSDESFPVYNLEASPFSDFVVEDGLIVHNSNGECQPSRLQMLLAREEGVGPFKCDTGLTWKDRTIASQGVIMKNIPARGSVVELGIGGHDAPEFRALIKAVEKKGGIVRGIEINPANVPKNLAGKVVISDILDSSEQALAVIRDADIVRASNLVIPYFEPVERAQFLKLMQANMKDGAKLIVSHARGMGYTFPGEEAFLYTQHCGKLKLEKYLYNVVLEDAFMYHGGHDAYSLIRGTIDFRGSTDAGLPLVIDPLDKTPMFDVLRNYVKEYGAMPWDEKFVMVRGEYVRSPAIALREKQLNLQIQDSIVGYLKGNGFSATKEGEMIGISLDRKIPSGFSVPEGLNSP